MARPPTYLSVTLGIIAAGASAYAWYLHGELLDARAKLAATPMPLARHLGATTGPAPAPVPALPVHLNVPDAAAGETTAESAHAMADRRGGPGRNNPQMQQLMALQRRSGLDARYATLFRKLNLSPTDLEKLKTLLVERQSASMDVYAAAREQGLDPRTNRDQIANLVKNFEAESDASIQDLLGAANYQQYKQYEQTAPQRNVVSQIEQRLSYTATPLYGNQSDQLIALIAATSPAPASSAAPFPAFAGNNQYLGARPQITDAVIAQSAGFLSQPQIQALRDLQQEQQLQAKVLQDMQQARRNNASSGPMAMPASGTGP